MLVRAKTDVRQLIMRHNHKNHIGSLCKSVFDFLSSKLEKPKQHIGHQRSEKPLYFLLPKKKKTKTRCYKTEKPETADGQQLDRKRSKNRSFYCKNRKSDLKDGQNRKSQRAPLQIQILGHAC